MNDTEPFQRARAVALRFLSYRPRSEAEVRSRLRRSFPPPTADQVIDDLKERGLLDDATFARLWKDSRETLRPRSAWAIKRELVSKGVDDGLAAETVQDVDDEESAYRAALSPARRLRAADFATFHRRLWGYLRRRGFSDLVCRHTLDRLWTELAGEDHSRQ
jgi:regulatory protein